MSYLLAVVALAAAGLALLDVLRLRIGRAVPDVALGWLVGTGWLAAAAALLRFALHVPFGRPALAAVLLAPIALWGALRVRRRGGGRDAGPDAVPGAEPASAPAPAALERARWGPRPLWVFVPMALYVVVVTGAVVLHGSNSPTQTDDGVRVRAFAPILARGDAWLPDARGIFIQAGPLPTFVPAAAWVATGGLDHFHVNYAVLTELVALLALAVGLGAARGAPERGWAQAFAVVSVPLFVYHCTSTYSDAVLAMRVTGGLLLALEFARTRDRADLERAALLVGIAALVKREGELVAAAPAAVLAAQVAWERWREGRPLPVRAAGLLVAPGLAGALAKIGAVGVVGAFPMLGLVFQQVAQVAGAGAGAGPAGAAAGPAAAASIYFGEALFRSGNQGMVFWILGAVLLARAPDLRRRELAWPLLAVAALFAEVTVSSILLVPQFTVDRSTVNRALLVASLPAAVWAAGVIVDAAMAEALGVPRRAGEAPVEASGRGEGGATRRERRRGSRPASRR